MAKQLTLKLTDDQFNQLKTKASQPKLSPIQRFWKAVRTTLKKHRFTEEAAVTVTLSSIIDETEETLVGLVLRIL